MTRPTLDGFVTGLMHRWEALAGTKREAIRQLGETSRVQPESKRRLLDRVSGEVSRNELDAEFVQVCQESRRLLKE